MASVRASQFEIVVKPFANVTAPFVRTVIETYFLDLTNLGSDSAFRFLAVIPTFQPPGAPGEDFTDREFTVSNAQGGPQDDPGAVEGNHNVFFDITGGPAAGQTAFGEFTFVAGNKCFKVYVSDDYKLCKGATALFGISPNFSPFGPPLLAEDRLGIRGWLAVARVDSSADIAAKSSVLLNAELRSVFLPLGLNSAGDPVDLEDVVHTQTSVTLASGQAENSFQAANPSNKLVQFAGTSPVPGALNLLSPYANLLNPIV